MRSGKPVSRTYDRLIDTVQTAWGRCWNIIRNPWVHDPLAALGMGGTRPRHQTAAENRRRGPHAGDGAMRGPSGRAGVGARLCAVVPHRWLQGVHDGAADTLRPVGRACAPAGPRPCAATPLDATARA